VVVLAMNQSEAMGDGVETRRLRAVVAIGGDIGSVDYLRQPFEARILE